MIFLYIHNSLAFIDLIIEDEVKRNATATQFITYLRTIFFPDFNKDDDWVSEQMQLLADRTKEYDYLYKSNTKEEQLEFFKAVVKNIYGEERADFLLTTFLAAHFTDLFNFYTKHTKDTVIV